MEILKENTNYFFFHKNTTNLSVYSENIVPNATMQITQIDATNVISEHFMSDLGQSTDSTETINLINDQNIIDLSTLSIHENCKYLMIFISNNNNNQEDNFEYMQNSNIFNFSSELPITKIVHNNYSSLENLKELINNEDLIYYIIYTTKRV